MWEDEVEVEMEKLEGNRGKEPTWSFSFVRDVERGQKRK